MTNDPHYEWHLHNLNGYAAYPTTRNQAPWGLDAIETAVGPVRVSIPGHGLNTRGLPGGTTPADRFVKMFLLREMAAHAPHRDRRRCHRRGAGAPEHGAPR